MLHSDLVAICAHLHVILRRRTGRVTDTEWMATNADYAKAMIAFARKHAIEDNAPELDEWAGRLERGWATPIEHSRQSFLDAAVRTVSMRVNADGSTTVMVPAPPPPVPAAPQPASGPKPPPPPGSGPGGSRYVGGLR